MATHGRASGASSKLWKNLLAFRRSHPPRPRRALISLVVDASVVIKWIVPEADSREARSLQAARLFAPDLLIAECINALWRRVQMSDITELDAREGWSSFSRAGVEMVSTQAMALRTFEMALLLKHPAYDCFYLAAAEQLGIRLVTADTRLIKKLAGHPTLATLT